MPKVLIVSDSPAIKSGLGRVTRELAARLSADGVDVAVAGWFDVHADIAEVFDYPVYPATKHLEESLTPLLASFQPDLVLAIGDPWDFEWLSLMRSEGTSWRLAGYLNIEGRPLPMACERILDGFDLVVTTSEYGAQTIDRPGVHAVHHGVDTSVFRRMARRAPFEGHDLNETFLVLLNGQNSARKNYPTAIRAFCTFARGKADVLLYMNTDAAPGLSGMQGADLRQTIVTLGQTGNPQIWFNPANRGPLQTVSDEHMNRIYNMATVLLVTSWAEGFCLPVLEAQAAGVVPIAPDDYSMSELIESRGVLYPVAARFENTMGMNVAVVSEADVVAALEVAYQEWKTDREGWNSRRVRCQAFAARLTWDATYQGLKEALGSAPPARVAGGREINAQLRVVARAAARRHWGTFGVLKLGGLGDLLQTTVVVAAAAKKTGRRAVVFTNQTAPVFEGMAEVAEVVEVSPKSQQTILESLADAFPIFYDVRYVSWVYGDEKPSPYAERHRWFYDHWTGSCSRLATLGRHTTEIMLESLGLGWPSIRPIYTPRRAPAQPLAYPNAPLLAVASGVGAMGGLKRWPQESWAKLMDLTDAAGFKAVQIGGPEDAPIPGAQDLRGLSLAETAWVIDHARAVIGVEGGMIHLAAATDTPAIVIFGPTPPIAFRYPGHKAARVIECTPCWGAEPMWAAEQCALGMPTCVNFPAPADVMDQLTELVHGH